MVITRWVFAGVRVLFRLRGSRARSFEAPTATWPCTGRSGSPHREHSWVPASGAVLDGASLPASTVGRPRAADAEPCIRAGYVALRRIADFFDIRHNPNPHRPEEPISIDRREFDQVCRQLAEAGCHSRTTWIRPGATSPVPGLIGQPGAV